LGADVHSLLACARRAASRLIDASHTERAAAAACRRRLVTGVHLIVEARGARIADRPRSVHVAASDTKSVCVGGRSPRDHHAGRSKVRTRKVAVRRTPARKTSSRPFRGVSDASKEKPVSSCPRHTRRLDLRCRIRRTLSAGPLPCCCSWWGAHLAHSAIVRIARRPTSSRCARGIWPTSAIPRCRHAVYAGSSPKPRSRR